MANIKPLVDYLKIFRRSREALKETENTVYVLDHNYNDANGNITEINVPKNQFNNGLDYIKLDLENYNTIYLNVLNTDNEPDSIIYYERRENGNVFEYRKLTSNTWEIINGDNFMEIELIEDENAYYYNGNTAINRVVLDSAFNQVFIFPDTFNYNPDHIPEISNNSTYKLDFIDHKGNANDAWVYNKGLDLLLLGTLNILNRKPNRKVEVNISQVKNRVSLYPFISTEKYTLKYVYVIDSPFGFDLRFANAAIKLTFKHAGAMLEFLNQTIFNEVEFDTINGNSKYQQRFLNSYLSRMEIELRDLKSRDIEKTLELLYYMPTIFLDYIGVNTLWDIVGNALEQNLNNIGLDEEDIVLALLQVVYKNTKTPTIFLTELLVRKGSDNESYFYKLFNKMNTANFVKYNNFIKDIWLQSDYVDPKNYKNYVFDKINTEPKYDGPLFLPYKSDKTIGFYHSNVDIDWADNYSSLKVELGTGEYSYKKVKGSRRPKLQEEKDTYYYHPFQPLYIKDVKGQKTALEFDAIIPACYLKAVEAKGTVSNWQTAGEYAIDVVTTVSGVGNLLKLRHITKFSTTLGKIINYARKGVAIIEITSGTTNALLKLTGVKDTKFGTALSEYLFYLEMLSLSVDVTDWISKGLKKSANDVLEHSDDLEKHLDDLVKKGEIDDFTRTKTLDELQAISDYAKFSKNIDSVRLKKLEVDQWRSIIESKKGKLRYADESEEVTELFRNDLEIDAMFRSTDIPPTIWIRRNRTTDLVLFHETMHFEDFLRRGKESYLRGATRRLKNGRLIEAPRRDELIRSYLREKYVLEKVLEEQANWVKKFGKGRWTENEIIASIRYFRNDYLKKCQEFGINLRNITLKQ